MLQSSLSNPRACAMSRWIAWRHYRVAQIVQVNTGNGRILYTEGWQIARPLLCDPEYTCSTIDVDTT